MKYIYILALGSITFMSCISSTSYEKVVAENNSLRIENQELKALSQSQQEELTAFRTNPEKLAKDAAQALKDENETELIRIQSLFTKYHPQDKNKAIADNCLKQLKSIQEQKRIAKEKAAKAEEEKRLSAVKKLRKKYDDVSGNTWYYNPYFTHYTNSNLTSMYIGQSGKTVWLRLQMSYYGDSWIFFDSAYLSYDGNTLPIAFDQYSEKETENDSSTWEWIDVNVTDSMLEFIRNMVNGTDVKMRLSGKYTKTRKLSTNEIKALKDIILAYDVLKAETK